MKKILSLIAWIIVIQGISFASGYLTSSDVNTWYLSIERSSLTPPNITFPIVWTILYTFIAIAGWSIWNAPQDRNISISKTCFIIQLFLNWSWTPVFFYLHLPGYAMLILAGILIFTAATIYYAWNSCRIASYLLIPYLLWGIFAGYLNGYIWYIN